MDNASAQIEKLQQEVASLRDQLGRTEAKMLTCLVRAEAKSLATQTELAMLKDAIAKDTAKTSDRSRRARCRGERRIQRLVEEQPCN